MSVRALWLRWRQVRGQSRIRLPAAPPPGEAIRITDRLQIGGRLWRVEGRIQEHTGANIRFALQAQDGCGSTATLVIARHGWHLEDENGTVAIDSGSVLHFAVAAQNDPRSPRPCGRATQKAGP